MQGVKGSRLHYSERKQYIDSKGYVAIRVDDNEERRIHRLIAIEVLGKPLPKGAVVHHVDGNYLNNEKSNLIILQNAREHKRLHALQRLISLGVTLGVTHYCYKCKRIKTVGSFGRCKRYHTGISQICKDCSRHVSRIYKRRAIKRKENAACEPYLLSKLAALGGGDDGE